MTSDEIIILHDVPVNSLTYLQIEVDISGLTDELAVPLIVKESFYTLNTSSFAQRSTF